MLWHNIQKNPCRVEGGTIKADEIISKLKSLKSPKDVEGMARFGINPSKTFGIRIPVLRKMAKEIGKNHRIALELWDSGYHEARILASMVDDYKQVSEAQMEKWVSELDSWDVCDSCVMNLFEDVEIAWDKAVEWSKKRQEFVKRAGFVMMARLAVSNKKAPDEYFIKFFPIIKSEADNEANLVKKAISWALRQIGKRNLNLNQRAIEVAREILERESKGAKWIAKDALKELTSGPVQKRISP